MDISKLSIDVTVAGQGRKSYDHRVFPNGKLGFQDLVRWSGSFLNEDSVPLYCMEHTGYYSKGIASFLHEKGHDYSLLNPLMVKRSMGFRREKSDKADSRTIAVYGLKFHEDIHLRNIMAGDITDLQILLSRRNGLVDLEKKLAVRGKHLSHCLSTKISRKTLRKIRSDRKYSHKRLLDLEKDIREFISGMPEVKKNYELLISVVGVGHVTALYTIVHTHNFTRMTDPRKFCCYCGVAPFKNESGTSVRRGTSVSHFANKKMKSLLSMAATSAIRHDPQMKAYYEKKVGEGKNRVSVINAIRNKIIHRMFATVKRGTPYVVQAQV